MGLVLGRGLRARIAGITPFSACPAVRRARDRLFFAPAVIAASGRVPRLRPPKAQMPIIAQVSRTTHALSP